MSRTLLLRELLTELVRCRCGARVAGGFSSIGEALPAMPVTLLVWDTSDLHSAFVDGTLNRIATMTPPVRVVRVDGHSGMASVIEDIRGALGPALLPREHLTLHEIEVLLEVAVGRRNAEIARRMHRSAKTVEKHRSSLQRKLGMRTGAQLAAYAIYFGLVDPAEIVANRES